MFSVNEVICERNIISICGRCQTPSHKFSTFTKCGLSSNKHNDKRETYLVQHFNQGACKGATYSCRIIQTVDRPAKIDNKLDPVATKYRRTMEDKWIAQLQTLYPYGLNNRMGKNSDQRKEDEPV